MSARPSSSTPTAIGDNWGRPSDRNVASTPRWCSRRYARASSRSMHQSLPGMGYNSAMIPIVPPELERYAELHTTPLPEHLQALAAETEKSMQFAQMMVGQLEGRFLEMLVFMTGARRVLEIGMFTGYSALLMASALPPAGRIVTCDSDPKAEEIARRHIEASPYADRIEIRMGPALRTIAELEGPLDLVLIDAD